MNIFALDKNPKLCAQYHNNKHLVKMLVESVQLLSSAYYTLGQFGPVLLMSKERLDSFPRESGFYKLTHRNHPSAIWTRSTIQNWKWLLELTKELAIEYTFRYGKNHSVESILEWMESNKPNLPDTMLEDFSLAMPEQYHPINTKINDTVFSYRLYYLFDKPHLADWGSRGEPKWHNDLKMMV